MFLPIAYTAEAVASYSSKSVVSTMSEVQPQREFKFTSGQCSCQQRRFEYFPKNIKRIKWRGPRIGPCTTATHLSSKHYCSKQTPEKIADRMAQQRGAPRAPSLKGGAVLVSVLSIYTVYCAHVVVYVIQYIYTCILCITIRIIAV